MEMSNIPVEQSHESNADIATSLSSPSPTDNRSDKSRAYINLCYGEVNKSLVSFYHVVQYVYNFVDEHRDEYREKELTRVEKLIKDISAIEKKFFKAVEGYREKLFVSIGNCCDEVDKLYETLHYFVENRCEKFDNCCNNLYDVVDIYCIESREQYRAEFNEFHNKFDNIITAYYNEVDETRKILHKETDKYYSEIFDLHSKLCAVVEDCRKKINEAHKKFYDIVVKIYKMVDESHNARLKYHTNNDFNTKTREGIEEDIKIHLMDKMSEFRFKSFLLHKMHCDNAAFMSKVYTLKRMIESFKRNYEFSNELLDMLDKAYDIASKELHKKLLEYYEKKQKCYIRI